MRLCEEYQTESERVCMSISRHVSDNGNPFPEAKNVIESMIEPGNLMAALKRVISNKGCAGVDGREVSELEPYLTRYWDIIKQDLLKGTYSPKPVLKIEIEKPGGGTRPLGIPTVLDRFIQQALHQVLSPIFEPEFSDNSYGFRPGRSAHQAILKAREYQQEGRRWLVDMDLKQFFEEVNHDVLIAIIRRKINDRRVLRLIRSYLRSGIMYGGVCTARVKGTPQGGPLSPLLSNILLNELDMELTRRGHNFCRYADDCNIYVKSRRSGERVFKSIARFVESKLMLKVNYRKSAVSRPWKRTFLGISFTCNKKTRIRVPEETLKKGRAKLKALFRKGRGRNLGRFIKEDLNPVLIGWINYFRISETKGFAEDLDSWIRRRLRSIIWRQWKRPWTRLRNLMKQGLPEKRAVMSAFNGRGPWWNSGGSHMNLAFPKRYFANLGLVSVLDRLICF